LVFWIGDADDGAFTVLVKNPYFAFGLILLALTVLSFYTSIVGLIKAEMFPAEIRALGVGLSYAIANALFGGTAEYMALWFKLMGMESNFYWYVTGMCLMAFVICYRMKETSRMGYLVR
jgi:MFS transporter, MHS family, alpha-ketoglutarate permease